MSPMDHTTQEYQSILEIQTAPPQPQDMNFHDLAAQKVSQVQGLDPSQTHLATFLASLQIKAEHDAKIARNLLEKSLKATIQTVNTNTQEINNVKQSVGSLQSGQKNLEHNQSDIYSQLHQIHSLAWKSYQMAAEGKQRSSKGNFIVQGEHVPAYTPHEDLYAKLFPIIQDKYGIYVNPSELKALHRLPNGKILFSLASRLPGQNFDNFTRQMNFNPKPHIKVYVSIQLFEPYAELYYIARRLKHYNVISNYRLDENGNTQISLSLTTQSFKFTGLDQLQSLQISIPPQINEEISYRRAQIQQNEEKSLHLNNEKSKMRRPNPPLSQGAPTPSTNQQTNLGPPLNKPLLTGANVTPVLSRVTAPPRPGPHPGSYPAQHNQYMQQKNVSQQTFLQDSRSKPVKRPHPINPSPQVQDVIHTNLVYYPPPSQEQYPQSSYPPYPQSFWTTPPPGDGPPTAWSTGSRVQTATAGLTGLTTVQTGSAGTSTGQAELTGTRPGYTGLADHLH